MTPQQSPSQPPHGPNPLVEERLTRAAMACAATRLECARLGRPVPQAVEDMEWLVGMVRAQTAYMQALATENANQRTLMASRMCGLVTDTVRQRAITSAYVIPMMLIPLTRGTTGRSDR